MFYLFAIPLLGLVLKLIPTHAVMCSPTGAGVGASITINRLFLKATGNTDVSHQFVA